VNVGKDADFATSCKVVWLVCKKWEFDVLSKDRIAIPAEESQHEKAVRLAAATIAATQR